MYRLPRCLALDFLDILQEYMVYDNACPDVPLTIQFCAVLNFYASGSYQRRVGTDAFASISQSCVSRCVRSISRIIGTQIIDRYVKFPDTIEEIEELEAEFQEMVDFPGLFLIVDATQVAQAALHRDVEFAHVNRKNFHSINVQIMGDCRMRIRNINARYPGSTHDSFIWKCSLPCAFLRDISARMGRNFNYFALADTGYPLQPWLLRPYDRPLRTRAQKVFNKIHKATRSLIERIIGILKARFRCLLGERKLRYDHERTAHIIYSCSVLHNFLIDNGYPIDDIKYTPDDFVGYVNYQAPSTELSRGKQRRDVAAQYFIDRGY